MTPRQTRFVEEYARLQNAAEAARRAGYSPFNAAVRGAVLLRSPAVAAALRAKGLDRPAPAPPRASLCRDEQGLTQRQRRFVAQYLICANASEAARRAGYAEGTAKSAGSRLKRSPAIVAALTQANAARAKRLSIDAERVLEEVARLSFVDLGDLVDWSDGALRLKAPAEIAPADRAALAQISFVAEKGGTRIKVKLFDKLRALEILVKHLGLGKPAPAPAKPDWEGRDWREELRRRIERMAAARAGAKSDAAGEAEG